VYRFSLPFPCPKDAAIKRRPRKTRSLIPEVSALRTIFHCETPLQFAAVRMAAHGLNVFPTLYGEKGGTPWRFMQYTKLNIEDLPEIFKDPCNIAVMTGATSGNLCVIDAETDQKFNWFVQQFEQHGIPVVAQRSGKPGGGGHLFVRCAEGEIANWRSPYGDWEIRGNRNYVLVAPSLHPTGTTYEWTHGDYKHIPTVSISDLSFMGAKLHTTAQKVRYVVDGFGNLSSRTRDFMAWGARVGERNYRLYIGGCDASGCGNSFDWAWKKLGAMAMLSGLSEKESHRTLKSAYSKPRQPARMLAGKRKQPKWVRAIIWALSRRWEGRDGASRRAVFIALCRRAKTASKELFRASNREVAELARLHVETANKTLHKLEDTGLIYRTGKDRSSEAFTYRLPHETMREPDSETPYTPVAPFWGEGTVRTLQLLLDSDLTERQALGQNAVILLAHMLRLGRGLSIQEWAQESFLTRSQIYYLLPRLVETGLVEQTGSIYAARVIEPEIIEAEIAASAGTAGKGEARRELHQRQRARYAMRRLVKALRARTCAWLFDAKSQVVEGQMLLPIAHNRI
jgi:predicted transcriptional regulator